MIQLNDELRQGVKNFIESPAGEWYVEKLDMLLNLEHNNAEDSPELSRDYAQRAKGIRIAKNELITASIIKEHKAKKV